MALIREDPCCMSFNLQPGYCAPAIRAFILASGIEYPSRRDCTGQACGFTEAYF